MAKKAAATKETETAEPADGPILDLTDADVKKLIKTAKSRGYVTYDELNKVLPSEEVSSEQIEDIMAQLSEMGINVVEHEEELGTDDTLVTTERQRTRSLVEDSPETREHLILPGHVV